MHNKVSAHFFWQDKISLYRVNDGDDVEDSVEGDAVLRGITGDGDGGMMGWEGAMALTENDSSDEAGSNDDDSVGEDDRQNSVESKGAWIFPINSNRSQTMLPRAPTTGGATSDRTTTDTTARSRSAAG